MADDAVNALIPVAAVVHIALGVMALILVRRSLEKEWNERFAGYLISWMMIVLGLKYAFATIIDLKIEDFTVGDFVEGCAIHLDRHALRKSSSCGSGACDGGRRAAGLVRRVLSRRR